MFALAGYQAFLYVWNQFSSPCKVNTLFYKASFSLFLNLLDSVVCKVLLGKAIKHSSNKAI